MSLEYSASRPGDSVAYHAAPSGGVQLRRAGGSIPTAGFVITGALYTAIETARLPRRKIPPWPDSEANLPRGHFRLRLLRRCTAHSDHCERRDRVPSPLSED